MITMLARLIAVIIRPVVFTPLSAAMIRINVLKILVLKLMDANTKK
jgi:hypothetical protein